MPEPDIRALRAEVNRLAVAASRLRDRFNTGRRLKAIWKHQEHFNSICSAMDVVGDCCFAMNGYLDHLNTAKDDKDLNYLIVYGLMNALYLQQDAVFYWGKYLGLQPYANYKKPGTWAMNIPALRIVREARNDATGHPVHREMGNQVCAFFISLI